MPEDQQRLVGRFKRSGSKESQLGELTLAGEDTILVLHGAKELRNYVLFPPGLMHGTTVNRQKVSLLRCVGMSAKSGPPVAGRRSHSAELFPNFVLIGNQHFHDDSRVEGAAFTLQHAQALFYDFFVFGQALRPKDFIKEILRSNFPDKEDVEVGPHPQVHYYTGKTDLLEAATSLGSVAVRLHAALTLPGPRGIHAPSAIQVDVTFKAPLPFDQALSTLASMTAFFDLLVGGRQPLEDLAVRVKGNDRKASTLNVYRSSAAGDAPRPSRRQSRDSLMPYMTCKDEIAVVMQRWVTRSEEWKTARTRFFDVFSMERRYTIDRIIGAANMFDLLPKSAFPAGTPLASDVREATAECKKIFRALPESLERRDMLDAIDRVGRMALKHKIRHRARVVADAFGKRLPRLSDLTDEAVNCRNHFVHGSRGSFDYVKNFQVVTYLCDTLEFVFGCSDLIEAGWDGATLAAKADRHPFGIYLHSYARASKEVLSLMESGKSKR